VILATSTMPPPPRLFAIFAQSAPIGVVVRRGPSAWTQLSLWDTRHDVFTLGAWFRGRIYAEKCDVSPDGTLFVYAAHQGGRLQTSYTDSWTAVSRPPWLHALALWPMGTTYGCGGRFVEDRSLILRGAGAIHPRHPAHGLTIVGGVAEPHRSTNEIGSVEWTGRDQANRLVFAAEGKIFARTGGVDLALVDFTPHQPDPRPAPDWAKRPIMPSGALPIDRSVQPSRRRKRGE